MVKCHPDAYDSITARGNPPWISVHCRFGMRGSFHIYDDVATFKAQSSAIPMHNCGRC